MLRMEASGQTRQSEGKEEASISKPPAPLQEAAEERRARSLPLDLTARGSACENSWHRISQTKYTGRELHASGIGETAKESDLDFYSWHYTLVAPRW